MTLTIPDWLMALALGVPSGLYLCHLLRKYINPLLDVWAERSADWLSTKLRIKK